MIYILLIILIIYLIIQTNISSSSTTSSVSTEKYNNNAIQQELLASGVQTKTGSQENFEDNSILFDSKYTLSSNFSKYFSIYFKQFNIDTINSIIKQYLPNETMETIEKAPNNIDFFKLLENMMNNNLIADFIYFTGTNENKILYGLAYIIFLKLNNYIEDTDGQLYYLNDFNTQNEFIIYYIHRDYNKSIDNIKNDTTLPTIYDAPNFNFKSSGKIKLLETIENSTKINCK
jgi:hypothetical protein